MKFNLWFIVALALLPVFALLAGLAVADDFPSFADWDVLVAFAKEQIEGPPNFDPCRLQAS